LIKPSFCHTASPRPAFFIEPFYFMFFFTPSCTLCCLYVFLCFFLCAQYICLTRQKKEERCRGAEIKQDDTTTISTPFLHAIECAHRAMRMSAAVSAEKEAVRGVRADGGACAQAAPATPAAGASTHARRPRRAASACCVTTPAFPAHAALPSPGGAGCRPAYTPAATQRRRPQRKERACAYARS